MTPESHIRYLNGEVARLQGELLKERTERTRLFRQLLAGACREPVEPGGRRGDPGPERMDSILSTLPARPALSQSNGSQSNGHNPARRR